MKKTLNLVNHLIDEALSEQQWNKNSTTPRDYSQEYNAPGSKEQDERNKRKRDKRKHDKECGECPEGEELHHIDGIDSEDLKCEPISKNRGRKEKSRLKKGSVVIRIKKINKQKRIPLNEAWSGQRVLDHVTTELFALASAKSGSKEQWKEAVNELGPEAAEIALETAKALPGIGNILSVFSAAMKGGVLSLKTFSLLKGIQKARGDIVKLAAAQYGVDFPDEKVGQSVLAKLFNIDDKMELPLKPEYLKSAINYIVSHLQNNLGQSFDPNTYAEKLLSRFLTQGTQTKWKAVEGPNEPA
tara:strand:+ start:5335 stop:6234 length:900 start_codon:yes stop_codon:yes gene_type:complete